MPAILVELIDETERARVKQAARACGISQKAFCRQAILQAAATVTGQADDVLVLLGQIRDAVCPEANPRPSSESQAAAEALVQMGMPRGEAVRRARAIALAQPDLDAAGIVKGALRDREGKS